MEKYKELLKRLDFRVFGTIFSIEIELDKKYGNRYYLQVKYWDRCRKDSLIEKEWHGRKWYLSDYMTEDEIVKTAFTACKSAVEHEVMEGFSVDGKYMEKTFSLGLI